MRPILALPLLLACTEYNIKGEGDPSEDAPVDTAVGALFLDPTEVDYGEVPLGAEVDATITATNVGTDDLWLTSVEMVESSGPFSVTFTGAPLLPPGESTTFIATFAPSENGLFTGAVEVESDAPVDGTGQVALSGGTGYPRFSISPEHHDFGTLEVGDLQTVDLVITNEGDEDGQISNPTFSSTSDAELSLRWLGDLEYASVTLAPGETYTVTAAYEPADDQADEATFAFETDAPDQPALAAILEGDGELGCEDETIELVITLTADDAWEGWLDGVEFSGPSAGSWSTADTVTLTSEPGCEHVLAIYAQDLYTLISGFMAEVVVYRGGAPTTLLTGAADWRATTVEPEEGWNLPDYDDSAWVATELCADTSPWGGGPADLVATGAQWVWWDSDCRLLGDAWLRLELNLE